MLPEGRPLTPLQLRYLRLAGVPEGCPLTPRQLQVLRLAAIRGLTHKEVGKELGMTEHTIKNHFMDILDRLGARNRVQAVFIATHQGWLEEEK